MRFYINFIITYESSSVLAFWGGEGWRIPKHGIIRWSLVRNIQGKGAWKKFEYQLLGSFNGSCRGIRVLLVVEQKNQLRPNLADRWLQLWFQYFSVPCSSNSNALIKVIFQYWPNTVPKQMKITLPAEAWDLGIFVITDVGHFHLIRCPLERSL